MSAELVNAADVASNRQIRLLRDLTFQRLASYHLYAISPGADARIIERDSRAMLGCWIELTTKFTPEEITKTLDRIVENCANNIPVGVPS